MNQEKYQRYESEELKKWKKLSKENQTKIVKSLSNDFSQKLVVVSAYNQSIKVELFVEKKETYNILVEYETYIREKLEGIPIIILLQERDDANKKRK